VAFTFLEASCVVVGTFNIYIIRPDWLGKIGVLPEGSDVKIETQMNQPGIRITSARLGARWTVSPTRLVLETSDANENCGQTLDRILESLPHTPLMALGLNVAYRGDASSIDHWQEKTAFPPSRAPEGYELKQRTWHIGVKRGEQVFNLQMSESEEGVEIHVNVHTELLNRDIDFARETARQFLQCRQTAQSLVRYIFNARIENGINNK